MKTLPEIQKELREILPQGIDLSFQALKAILPDNTDKYKDLLLLEGRYRDVNQQLLQGIISNEDAQLEFNKIRKLILDLINELQASDLQEKSQTHEDGTPDIYNGEVLYRIPKKMQVQHKVKCLVRVAFNKQILMEDLEKEAADVIKDIRISDVMGVELIDPNSEHAFEITTLSETVQFVEKDLFTEWVFYVKPLLEGTFPLVLKISVIEIRDGIERKRNVVLEENVQIIATDPVEEKGKEEFVASGYSLHFAGNYANAPGNLPKGPMPHAPNPAAPVRPAPSNVPPRPGSSSPMRKIVSVMSALLVLLVASWAIWSAMQDPAKNDWNTTADSGSKGDYEDFIKKYPASEQAKLAQNKLDSIETVAWERAVASADTTQILAYIDEYPQGHYVTEALLMLERGKEPVVKNVMFSWQVQDTALVITHEGGFAPFNFSFIQNGQSVKLIHRDSIGGFNISLKDLKPGVYEIWLQDSEGRLASDSISIEPPKNETPAGTKKGSQGVTKTNPKKKKNPVVSKPPVLPPTPPVVPEEKKPDNPAAKPQEPADKPVPMKSAARLPVYKGCDSSKKDKEEKCTERKIRDFVNDNLKYPRLALDKRVQGTVVVYFVVERDGSITDVKAGNDIGGGCAGEAERIVSRMPKFKPGQNSKGEPVRIQYSLPITFRLN